MLFYRLPSFALGLIALSIGILAGGADGLARIGLSLIALALLVWSYRVSVASERRRAFDAELELTRRRR